MNYTITNGAVSFGADTVLENINFTVKGNEKVAVVGRNGAGKTTLLKCIAGEAELEKGTGEEDFSVSVSGEPVIGYLRQISFSDDSVTMGDELLKAFAPIFDTEREMESLLKKIDRTADEADIKRYSELCDRFDYIGGYTYKKEFSVMVRKFGFSEEDTKKKLSEFSGGQRTKIAFMKLLLSKPDLLLLDEPTNHLDITTVRWLEDYLRAYRSAVVIVSHDRMFLNRIVSKVYEIEYGETVCYAGNYADFERLKRINYEKRLRDHEAQQKEIARIEQLIERFRYKATKAKMVQSKIKMLERMKKADMPNRYDLKTFHTNFEIEIKDEKSVFSAKDLKIGYDSPLMTVDIEMLCGQKLAVIGDNGIGKSTFLKTVMGLIPPISGSFRFGMNARIGYFDQSLAEVSGNETVLQNFQNEFPALTDGECRSCLGAFLFSGDEVFKTVDMLSGGERVRLSLCKLFKKKPNFLILDEPTNHMDIVGKETLENILKEYEGTVIAVSHDRYFVDKTADRLLIMDSDGAHVFDGKFAEYEVKRAEAEKEAEANVSEVRERPKKSSSKKGYTTPLKERQKAERRKEKLEALIEEYTGKADSLKEEMQSPDVFSDYEKLVETEKELNGISAQLEEYMEEWAALCDTLDSMNNE